MKKSVMLVLSAVCAGLTIQAAMAATQPVISGPAYSVDALRQPLKQPANFDASRAGSGAAAARELRDAHAPLLKAPAVINSGLRYQRLQPVPLVTDHYDAKLERPTFIWAGKQAGNSLAFLAYRQGEGARSYARAYLHEFASQLKIGPAMVDDAELVFLHDDGEGAVIARYQQRVNGLAVMNRQLNVVMNQDLELIAISGYFASAKGAANKDFSDAFRAGPTAAMNTAFADLGLPVSAYNLYDTSKTHGGFAQFAPSAGVASAAVKLTAPVGARKVLFPVGDELVPGYQLIVQAGQAGTQDSLAYTMVASADGSRLLFRKNLVAQDSYQYRVFADAATLQPDDSPFGNDLVPHPTGNPGDALVKTFGAGTLVTVAVASQGITDPWLPSPIVAPPGLDGVPLFVPAVQTTFGNNVYAYADVGGADGPENGIDIFAAISAAGVFDYTADFNLQPTNATNQQAAIVNLFYLNNWLHDAWYNAGFTELTGNAQYSNYGRGGLEDTYILAEAQDSSGRNNANMATGPDGTYTRMQMYIFDGPIASQTTEATSSGGTGPFTFDPAATSSFGAKEFDITAELAIYDDGDTSGTGINGQFDACQATAQDLTGKIALIADIYTCNFTVKVKNAQDAGAIGALVVYNGATAADAVFAMGGSDPTVTIPSLGVSDDDADPVIADIGAGNTVTLHMLVTKAPDREGAFDSQVVAHEFFHYVSNRLVGDASGLSNMQGGGMGEGWGDVAGLLLTARDADLAGSPDGAYGMGGYDTDDFYQAIRRYPYSTDMTKNPQTFADIATDVEVHNLGEIWAIALWEAYVGLYNHYETVDAGTAFTEAKTRMMGYIIEGLMATPNAPTMIEARDAILSVVQAADATDYGIFVTAFAKRGMGWGAIAPPRDSTDMIGVVESFETDLKTFAVQDAAFDPDAPAVCDVDASLDPGETGELTLTVLNTGSADLTGVTAQLSSTSDLSFAAGGLVTFAPDPLAMFGGTLTATATVTVNTAASTSEVMDIDVTFPDVGGTPADVTEPGAIVVQFLSNQDYARTAFADDVENSATSLVDWTRSLVGGGAGWSIDNQFSDDLYLPATNDYWYGPDNDQQSDITLTTPPIVVGGSAFSVSFYHYYQFEDGGWDGGVVEITTDGGATWQDVTAAGGTFAFGYNGAIVGSNPVLGGRTGFVNFGGTVFDGTPESISFGTALAGQTVQLRFRVGSDPFVGELGWIVDDVTVTGASVPMFSSVVAENGLCGDAAPVANAGANQALAAAATVTLDGSASTDDGTLSYAWTQVGGTTVTLSDASAAQPTFAAPFGTASYTFLLTVTDNAGQTAADSVTVNVTDAAPTANAGLDQNVAPGATVTLDGSASSDEGTLTYAWVQTAGDSVTLSDANVAQPTFTAPAGDGGYTFELTVTDQNAQTATDTVTVTVQDEAPVANAGPDQSVTGSVLVTLDGSASSDEGTLTYAWAQTAGDSVTLSDASAAQPTFTTADADATLTFELTVTDEIGQTATDSVSITVAKSQDDQGDDNNNQGGGGGGGSTGVLLLGALLGLGLLRRRRQ